MRKLKYIKRINESVEKIYTQAEIFEILKDLIPSGTKYRKVGKGSAVIAKGGEKIQTILKGEIETENVATKGDYIFTNEDSSEKETYIIKPDDMAKKYAFDGEYYIPTGKIVGVELTEEILNKVNLPKEFKFHPKWHSENYYADMIAKIGDIMAFGLPELNEVWRIEKDAFKQTYVLDVE